MFSGVVLLVLLHLHCLASGAAASDVNCSLKDYVCECRGATNEQAAAVNAWLANQSDCRTVRFESCSFATLPQWSPAQLNVATPRKVAYEIRNTQLQHWNKDLYTGELKTKVSGNVVDVEVDLISLLIDSGSRLESDVEWIQWLLTTKSINLALLVIERADGFLNNANQQPTSINAAHVRLADIHIGPTWSALEKFVKALDPTHLELENIRYAEGSAALNAQSLIHQITLQTLAITGCRINDADFASSNLKNTLKSVNISNNELTRLDLNALAAFKKLSVADFSHNSIAQLDSKPPNVSSGDAKPLVLHLQRNKLQALDLSDLRALPNLQVLDVSSNWISSLTRSDSSSANTQLRRLLFENNRIASTVSLELFVGYPKLQIVDLSDNQIVEINVPDSQPVAAGGLFCIVDLRGNKIEWISPRFVNWAKAALNTSRERCTSTDRYKTGGTDRKDYGVESPLVLLAENPWNCTCGTWNATHDAAAFLDDSVNAACAVETRGDCRDRVMPKCKRRPKGFEEVVISEFSRLLNQSAACSQNQSYVNGVKPAFDESKMPVTDRAGLDLQMVLIVAVVTFVLCVAVGATCLMVCRARSSSADPQGQYAQPVAQPVDNAGGHKNASANNNEKGDAGEV